MKSEPTGAPRAKKGKLPKYWDVCYGCFNTIKLTKEEWDHQFDLSGTKKAIMYMCEECA